MIISFAAMSPLRKAGFVPYLLPFGWRERHKREQAVIQ
jgi:hypothetical protein